MQRISAQFVHSLEVQRHTGKYPVVDAGKESDQLETLLSASATRHSLQPAHQHVRVVHNVRREQERAEAGQDHVHRARIGQEQSDEARELREFARISGHFRLGSNKATYEESEQRAEQIRAHAVEIVLALKREQGQAEEQERGDDESLKDDLKGNTHELQLGELIRTPLSPFDRRSRRPSQVSPPQKW